MRCDIRRSVEHPRGVQVHHHGGCSLGLGEPGALLAVCEAAADRVVRLGQAGEGVEPEQLQAAVQPRWSLGPAVRVDDLAGWLALRVCWLATECLRGRMIASRSDPWPYRCTDVYRRTCTRAEVFH